MYKKNMEKYACGACLNFTQCSYLYSIPKSFRDNISPTFITTW